MEKDGNLVICEKIPKAAITNFHGLSSSSLHIPELSALRKLRQEYKFQFSLVYKKNSRLVGTC